jgi:hypothetical protein
MAAEHHVVSHVCAGPEDVGMRRDALGFRTARCTACQRTWTLPLSTAYRLGYVVLTLLWLGMFTGAVVNGTIRWSHLPGVVLLVLFVSALLRDAAARRQRSAR